MDMNPGGYEHQLVHNVQLNICDRKALADFAQQLREEQGKCDVIINNAAITRDGMLHKLTEDKWDAVIEVNLKGTFNVIQALVPFLLEQKKGSIICVSSGSGVYGNIGQTNYAATKAGLIGMRRTNPAATAGKKLNWSGTSLEKSICRVTIRPWDGKEKAGRHDLSVMPPCDNQITFL